MRRSEENDLGAEDDLSGYPRQVVGREGYGNLKDFYYFFSAKFTCSLA